MPKDDDGGGSNARARARDAAGEVVRALDIKGRVDRHPYGTLAAAVGIGYILGGGFFTPLTGRLVRLGMKLGVRLAVVPFLNEEVMSMVGDVITGQDSDGGEQKRRRGRQTASEGK